MLFYKELLFVIAISVFLPAPMALAQGDPVNGQRQFERKCDSCHSPVAGEIRLGPSLFGVVGRQSGTVSGFTYSNSLVDAGNRGLVWLPAQLDSFLTNPPIFLSNFLQQKSAPTRMTLKLPDPQVRADIIAYLAPPPALLN